MAEPRGLGERADVVREAVGTMADRLGKPRHGTLPHALFEELLRAEPGPGQLEPAQAPRERRQDLDQGQGEQRRHVPRSGQGRLGARDLRPGIQVEQSVEYREEAPILAAGRRALAHRLRGNGLNRAFPCPTGRTESIYLQGASTCIASRRSSSCCWRSPARGPRIRAWNSRRAWVTLRSSSMPTRLPRRSRTSFSTSTAASTTARYFTASSTGS